ncbi:MAG: CPBP family intramembrane metalloprotease [Promethearchaeota archaeon]|nr:MAG: CPBP family intramembrane metalloprotease [Candidatus Lokiarchaeota archaeon]
MNNKEVEDPSKKQAFTKSKNKINSNDENWSFCPVCGFRILKINKLKFCVKCGTNLKYLREHKELEPKNVQNPYIKQTSFTIPYILPRYYDPKKISDNNIIDTKNQELWGTMASISVPLGAFFLMNFITAGLLAAIAYFSFNIEFLFDLVTNPYFLIVSSFFEVIFIIVPVIYVEKFLQNPTLKNRLGLLGFTSNGLDKKGIFKEILIGLGFAVIGLLLVTSVSLLTEIILELFFGIEIVRDLSNTTTDVEMIILSADFLSIIFLSLIMILIIGTSEEILFRGFMQKGLMRSLGNKWGIIVSAFIFSMIHLLGIFLMFLDAPLVLLISFILSFIPYFAISMMLGLLYYWRNENLIANIIAHGVYNALAIILAYLVYYVF